MPGGRAVIVNALPLEGAAEILPEPHPDHRGWFARWFCQKELEGLNGGRPIQQVNSSFTLEAGTVRGLHHQRPPYMEDRMVRCIRGRVYDVIVDLRAGSPTLLQWHATVLDAERANMLYIPRGFTHGFQALEDDSQTLYLHTEFHTPEATAGFRFDSPSLSIDWPLPVSNLSERDRGLPPLPPDFEGM